MINNLRGFKITQKFNTNGNRITTILDSRNLKKVTIEATDKDDAEEMAKDFFSDKNINIIGKFENKKELYFISDNFNNNIK